MSGPKGEGTLSRFVAFIIMKGIESATNIALSQQEGLVDTQKVQFLLNVDQLHKFPRNVRFDGQPGRKAVVEENIATDDFSTVGEGSRKQKEEWWNQEAVNLI